MKQSQINQIESIVKKSWFEIIKLFLIVFFLKNPLIYFPLYPRINPKNSLIQVIISRINLGCFAIAIKSFFYIDFFKTWSNNIGCFLAIRYKGKNIHKRYFMPKQYLYIYKAISNNKGFAYTNLIESIFKYTFFIIISFLMALITSLSDIEIPSYQESINNLQYMLKNISIFF